MADERKPRPDPIASHGRDLQKVNQQLKSLMASLRTERERFDADPRHHAVTPPPPLAGAADARDAEVGRLSAELAGARQAIAQADAEREQLRTRLAEIEAENQRICDDYVAVQEKSTELAELFVVLERIHGGFSRAEMLDALQEIVVNVVGSEELAVFERRGDVLELARAFGVDADALRRIRVGQGAIGRAAATGKLYVANREGPPAPGEEDVTAVIPLRVGSEIAGAIAIFRLLGHKPGLDGHDEAIFGLLAAHAGAALHLRGARERPVTG